MVIYYCCNGLTVTAAVLALLLVPVQYYAPDLHFEFENPLVIETFESPPAQYSRYEFWSHLPPLDVLVTTILFVFVIFIYICEWIQVKLMKRRIAKLNQYLGVSLERLRELDAQQEQLEITLKMVQNATSEYNLLLYLLLHQHRCLTEPDTCKTFAKRQEFV